MNFLNTVNEVTYYKKCIKNNVKYDKNRKKDEDFNKKNDSLKDKIKSFFNRK